MTEFFQEDTAEQKELDHYFDNKGEVDNESTETKVESESEAQASDSSSDEATIEVKDDDESNKEDKQDDEPKQYKKDTPEQIEKNLKAALKEERTRRQTLEKQFKETSEKTQQIQQYLQQLAGRNEQQQPQAPDFEEDPINHLRYQQEQLQKSITEQQQFAQQSQQQQQQQQQVNQLLSSYKQQAQQFSEQASDFGDAYKFTVQSMVNEYKAMGYSDEQANNLLKQDELALAYKSQQEGVNPAERIYELAKIRGYTPNQNGDTQNKHEKFNNIQQGMEKSKSMSGAGGVVDKNKISLNDIASMNEEQIDKLYQKMKSGNLNVG